MLTEEYKPYIGKRLLNNIYDATGTLLISKDSLLLESHIMKLANFKIKTSDIQVAENSDENNNASTLNYEIANQTKGHLYAISDFVQHNGEVPIVEVESKILPYIEETAKRFNLFHLFSEQQENENYRLKQNLSVAVIATSLGKRLGLDEQELDLLKIAATLYDIGIAKLPSSIINKSGKFDIHEYEIMKQHTVFGHEILQNSDVDSRVALVALQHHEREDGSGYPNGLKGDRIDKLSKIVALSDVFVILISDRPHRPAFSFFEAIDNIHHQIILNKFDSVIGLTLVDMLLSKQIGREVLLSDDRKGTILLTDINYPTKPLIVLDNQEFVDLTKIDNVKILKIIG